jgi:hypothetical protein
MSHIGAERVWQMRRRVACKSWKVLAAGTGKASIVIELLVAPVRIVMRNGLSLV